MTRSHPPLASCAMGRLLDVWPGVGEDVSSGVGESTAAVSFVILLR